MIIKSIINSYFILPILFDSVYWKMFEPDAKVSQEDSFDEAYILALKNLSQKAEGAREKQLDWMADYHRVQSKPYVIEPGTLEKMAGSYKSIKVMFETGKLCVIWPGETARHLLLPLSKEIFLVDGDWGMRLEFVRSAAGTTTVLMLIYIDDYIQQFERVEE